MSATARNSSSNLENSFPHFHSLRGRRYLVGRSGKINVNIVVPDRDENLPDFLQGLSPTDLEDYELAAERESRENSRLERGRSTDVPSTEPKSGVVHVHPDKK